MSRDALQWQVCSYTFDPKRQEWRQGTVQSIEATDRSEVQTALKEATGIALPNFPGASGKMAKSLAKEFTSNTKDYAASAVSYGAGKVYAKITDPYTSPMDRVLRTAA